MAPEAAGTQRATRGGVSLARIGANSEGPRRGASLLGRGRRSLGAQRAGASKRREAAHPRGKTKTEVVVVRHSTPLVGGPVGAGGFFVALPAARLLRMTS